MKKYLIDLINYLVKQFSGATLYQAVLQAVYYAEDTFPSGQKAAYVVKTIMDNDAFRSISISLINMVIETIVVKINVEQGKI